MNNLDVREWESFCKSTALKVNQYINEIKEFHTNYEVKDTW
jgi:hypothetical protein